MARTANRYLKKNIGKEKQSKVYQAGNYLRLSVDSDYTGSDSLENQRKLAKEYVEQCQDMVIVKEYMDDGKTGTNFERPAFSRMIADLKQGEINCIIVKDLSRFGREYIEAGNYIEKVFPFLGVRFISIVDRYDSKDPGCDRELLIISLKNLMHEMYARDISKKVGSTFQMKHEKGLFYRSSTIPYGYKMDLTGENYCVEEDTATIVEEIFVKYSNGISRYTIGQWLYDNRVLTPSQYRQTGRIYREDHDTIKAWHSSTIKRILENPVYIGNVLRHKTEQSFFEGKKAMDVPEEDQVVIVGNHQPIVSEDVFRKVQERLQGTNNEYREYRKDSDMVKTDVLFEKNVFSGKIFCGDCKTGMARTVSYRKVNGIAERFKVFKCKTHMETPSCCDARGIEENDLCEILCSTIRKHIPLLKGVKKLIDKDIKYSFGGKMQQLESERQRLQNQQIILEQDYIKAYAQCTSGRFSAGHFSTESASNKEVSMESFQRFRQSYIERERSLKLQLDELEKEKKQIKKQQTTIRKMIEEWLEFDNAKELTERMITICVERIEIFQGNRLEIKLRYQDVFMILADWIKRGGAGL